jgi:hypothetical protein
MQWKNRCQRWEGDTYRTRGMILCSCIVIRIPVSRTGSPPSRPRPMQKAPFDIVRLGHEPAGGA